MTQGTPHASGVVAGGVRIVENPEVNSVAMVDVNKGGRDTVHTTYFRVILSVV